MQPDTRYAKSGDVSALRRHVSGANLGARVDELVATFRAEHRASLAADPIGVRVAGGRLRRRWGDLGFFDEAFGAANPSVEGSGPAMRLRCRIGLHKWVRIRETDPTFDNPSQSAEWRTICRDCKTERGSGLWFSIILFTTVLAVGVVGLWYFPLLGAILIIGSVGAMGIGVMPAVIGRLAEWLGR